MRVEEGRRGDWEPGRCFKEGDGWDGGLTYLEPSHSVLDRPSGGSKSRRKALCASRDFKEVTVTAQVLGREVPLFLQLLLRAVCHLQEASHQVCSVSGHGKNSVATE